MSEDIGSDVVALVDEKARATTILIDGNELQNVSALSYELKAGKIDTVTFTILARSFRAEIKK